MTDFEFEECICQMQQGKKEGLKAVYESYIGFMYHVIYEVVRNKEIAEDVTSEFFIKLWSIADQYQFGGKHKAWIATIGRNMAIDYIRKYKKEQLVEEMEEPIVEKVNQIEEQVLGNLNIEKTLETLNDSEREVIHLKVIGEFTFKEIAKIMKLPMGTVTWKYQNAIQKLRRCGYE